ncbi:hypothetical protein CM318V1_280002 [Carnobacterium maltaromaticum]|uniref:hypothetical protein n=1 Tax=Carnobacterium maltaromaticum TaxID=2751 RepID=UPI00070509A4|nr:hypothetical protein [Carnobacterium maltaromaticum]KRN71377.1 hypothetical protein IV76_GL000877 [Carnobacterium maltaromaticum]CRH18721.1 hypothetical protein CM318V1_280002 [Carnobacterium maltaromaticum]
MRNYDEPKVNENFTGRDFVKIVESAKKIKSKDFNGDDEYKITIIKDKNKCLIDESFTKIFKDEIVKELITESQVICPVYTKERKDVYFYLFKGENIFEIKHNPSNVILNFGDLDIEIKRFAKKNLKNLNLKISQNKPINNVLSFSHDDEKVEIHADFIPSDFYYVDYKDIVSGYSLDATKIDFSKSFNKVVKELF